MSKPIIIAEACQNHNGDLKILREMIYTAKEAGADYIKIQSILADELSYRERFENGVIEDGITKVIKRPYQSEYDRLKILDLNDDDHSWFVEECHKAGIKPMTTIFTFSRIKFLSSLNWDTVKVASYDCASYPFLKELSENFKQLYISTGATNDNEIKKTADVLKGKAFSFLHCVTIYPTPLNEIHLRRIDWLRQYSDKVGFSDHTLVERDGLKATLAAIYYGADIIERHFTVLDRSQTKDGPISVNSEELSEIVEFAKLPKEDQQKFIEENISEYSVMLGQEKRKLREIELLNRDYYRGRFSVKINNNINRYNWEN